MGCLFSRHGHVRTLSDNADEPLPASAFSTRGAAHAWLQEIGLPQYAEAFEDAGFSDWDLLSCLTEADLVAITAHTGTAIPPGHKKKLLMASRQMGATSQATPATPVPLGSARRYSHTSNPGNGSRAGGLTAAATAAASLERRSNGRRPSSSSRVPSLASVHVGLVPGLGHPPHHVILVSGQSRNATEDGMVSGRRSRAVGVMVPSRNSSRGSLPAMPAGHAIGYIASPSATAQQEGVTGVPPDAWFPADVRRSPGEPGSPTAAGGAGGSATADGGPTPPRQRRRWSVNKSASRGVLLGGGGAAGGVAVSASSYRWLEPESAAAVLGGAGPINDDVRQISMTSSIGDAYRIDPGGVGQGGGGAAPVVQQCLSRDLDALVMGASGSMNRAQSSRCQSLAATRPDRSYRGGVSNGGLPSSPPHRISGGNAGGGTAAGAAPHGGLLGDSPYIRGSLRQSATAAGTAAAVQQPPPSAAHSHSHPNLDGADSQQTPPRQQRIGSARDGSAAAALAGTAGAGAASWTIVGQAPSQRQPEGAVDSTLKSWAPPAAAVAAAAQPPGSVAGGASLPQPQSQPSPPGVAWAMQGDVNAAASGGAGVANASTTSGSRPYDGDTVFPTSTGAGRSTGTHGGALPRFVRAIAGWAIPNPAAGGATVDGGGGGGAAAGGGGGGGRRIRSGGRHRRGFQRQSDQVQGRQRSPSDGPSPVLVHDSDQAAQPPPAAAARPAAGDVLAAEAPPSAGRRNAPSPEPSVGGNVLRNGRSQRHLLVPDALTPRGPWDQDSALCIQGRGYKPQAVSAAAPAPMARGPSRRSATAAGDEDSDATPSSVTRSRPISGVAVTAASTNSNFASPVAASRGGGGWPFVIPQLPLPNRPNHAGELPPAPPPPPLGSAAALTAARAIGGSKRPSSGGSCGSRLGSPNLHGPGHGAAAAIAVPSAAADGFLVPTLGSGSVCGGGLSGTSTPAEAAGLNRMAAAGEPSSSMLLESLPSDASTATTAKRPLLVHSARPRDWCPSVGGASEATAPAKSDVESSADELALYGSGSAPRPHRVQIVTSAMAMASPYGSSGGGGGLPPLLSGGGAGPGPVSQWPALPLQPPTRAKPAPPSGPGGAGSSATAATQGRMEILTPEAPGQGRYAAAPPGAAAASDLPRPTQGRKLDLEMLAEQVGRIMSHLSNIAKEGEDEDMDMVAPPPLAAAAAGPGGGGGGGGGANASESSGAAVAGGRGAPSRQGTARMQAIDQKRLELQHLHQDLVRRVAAMEAEPAPSAAAAAEDFRAAAGAAGYHHISDADASDDAAEALAEVESRIRSKLTELAALTMRPDPDRRTAGGSGGGGSPAHAAGAGGGSFGQARKRALGPEELGDGGEQLVDGNGGGAGGAGGHRRAREEVALHLEVLAVLGARKRHVRGAGASVAASAAPSAPISGAGSEEAFRQLHQQTPPGPSGLGSAAGVPPSAGGAAAAAGEVGGAAGGGAVLAEMQDALRAELLAIDSKIKARVRGVPGAVARRS